MREKSHYLSLARVFAAIAIIILHTDETWMTISRDSYWLIDNIIIGIVRFGVPIFFMTTGATLMDYRDRYDTKTFYKKRLVSVVIPLFIWRFIAIVFEKITGATGISFLYWFLFALIGMYLCIPVFSALKDDLKELVITSVIIISFVLNYLMPFVTDIFNISVMTPPFNVGEQFIIYILLGYMLHKKQLSLPIRIVSYLFSLLGLFIIIFGTYYRSLKTGVLDHAFGDTLYLPCLLWATGVFIFFKQIGPKITNKKVINIINFLNGYVMASYILHPYILRYVLRPLTDDVYSLTYKLGAPIINFLICVLIAYIIKKIPVLRKILP